MQYQSQLGLLVAAALAVAFGFDTPPMRWSGDNLFRDGYTMRNTLIGAGQAFEEGQVVRRAEPEVTVRELSLEEHPAAAHSIAGGAGRAGAQNVAVTICFNSRGGAGVSDRILPEPRATCSEVP